MVNPDLNGATQMAIDEALLEEASNGNFIPTVRLYSWKPACLSLGYAQPSRDVDIAALSSEGWDLVRRPTGGRAILHVDELTYAVILPLIHPVASGSLMESYRRIAGALSASLNLLGCTPRSDANYELPDGAIKKAPVCFEVPSNYEITVDGKKLIGSAQARRKDALLQHGSLPLQGELRRITRVLALPKGEQLGAAARLTQHATTLEMALGTKYSWNAVREVFEQGFRSHFNITFRSATLTETEWQHALRLRATKYSLTEWNLRM